MPCGYAVDWLRSCYLSKWLLFRNSDLKTPGRYYFPFALGASVRHYPFPHIFGSRNWTSDEREPQPIPGEANDEKQTWFRGLPVPFPEGPGIRGSSTKIATGGLFPQDTAANRITAGADPDCHDVPIPPPDI